MKLSNCFIISAHDNQNPMMNTYRQRLLKDYLNNNGYDVTEGIGKTEDVTEKICIVILETKLTSEEISMLEELCIMFQQDYFLEVQNDKALKYEPGFIYPSELGTFWDCDTYTPAEVIDCVKKGIAGNEYGAYTYVPDFNCYYGIETIEMMQQSARHPYVKKESADLRSFAKGTEDFYQRQAALARSIQY